MLDKTLLEQLQEKAILLNVEDMQKVLKKIEKEDNHLYEMLQKLIEEMNYSEIITALKNIKKAENQPR